jgi:hypothetical protein
VEAVDRALSSSSRLSRAGASNERAQLVYEYKP